MPGLTRHDGGRSSENNGSAAHLMNDNLVAERPTFVTHLECSLTGERYEADRLHGLSRAGRPLLVRYDLAAAGAALSRDALTGRETDLWRWREDRKSTRLNSSHVRT